ncbi:AAA family ATPase [Kocuria sp. CPCC 205268]|uniref:McrB family protein n=1 Tax=Kocuria oxytropis TaxID=3058913 RepID=UPI0034D4B5B1
MGDSDDVTTGRSRVVLPSAQPMYRAADRWRDEALIDDHSLFSGEPLDGAAAAQELVEAFVLQPDVGAGTFYEKLEQQLEGVSPAAVQLAAELMFVYYLIVTTGAVKPETKRQHVRSVLGFRASGTSAFPADLFPALAGGVANPGTAYNTYRWKMLAYLIRFVEAVKARPRSEREATLTNWDTFQQLLEGLDEQSVWTQRYALEHLLFPDRAPKIVSRDDRQAVSKAFAGRLSGELPVDEVARRLEPNAWYGERGCVDFYRTPYREQWQKQSPKLTAYVSWARRFLDAMEGPRGQWLQRAQHAGEAVSAAKQHEDVIAPLRAALADDESAQSFLTWARDNDDDARHAVTAFTEYRGAEAVDQFLGRIPSEALPMETTPLTVASTLLMAQGAEDFPLWPGAATSITTRLTDTYAPHQTAAAGEKYDMFLECLDIVRRALGNVEEPWGTRLDAAVLADLLVRTSRPDGWDDSEWRAFEGWRAGKAVPLTSKAIAPTAASAITAPTAARTAEVSSSLASLEDLATSLSMDNQGMAWLEETVDLLKHKRQLIIQGPPGTGKTYIGRKLAEFLAGDPARVTVTQFHPGTSYEDFVQGLRPDPENPTSFTVVDGPLLRVAREAGEHPDNTYVLLVDEINRGNVPAVFGELYYLLEYREHEVTLTYGDVFGLPENLFLIGTMNTADRSITALDSALRRRFYVRDLRPGEVPVDGMLRQHLQTKDAELGWLADLLARANDIIKDRDQYVGPSHFMGEGMDETWARRAWENTVMPTLREVFYSRPDILIDLEFETLKAAVTQTAGDAAAD